MDTIYSQDPTATEREQFLRQATPSVRQAAQSELVGGNIQLNTLDLWVAEDQVIEAQGPATFCIAVFLEGRGQLSIKDGPQLAIEPGMTVVFHAPQPTFGSTLFLGDHQLHCLDIRYSLDFLSSVGVDSLQRLVPMFQQDCSVANVTMLARPTSSRLMGIAKDILSCSMQGLARSVYLQGKSLEALAQVLEVLEPVSDNQPRLSKQDRQRVQQAISLLDQQFQVPWTIARLAREVGINERKLKSGFHQLVQSTVHSYLEGNRLNAARDLLSAWQCHRDGTRCGLH